MFIPPSRHYFYATAQLNVRFTNNIDGSFKIISGTCFYVRSQKNMFVVTNRHIIDYSYYIDNSANYYLYDVIIHGRKYSNFDKKNFDVFVSNIGLVRSDVEMSDNHDEDVAVFMVPNDDDIVAVDVGDFATADDFASSSPGDPVVMYGYSKLANVENPSPIARSGIFASDPAFDYRIQGQLAARRIAVEAMSTQGMSGSPVIAFQRGMKDAAGRKSDDYRRMFLAGVNVGHYHDDDQKIGSIHSQIGICIRSTVILELMNQVQEKSSWRVASHA
jgi:Trypsin-like peptidase domain